MDTNTVITDRIEELSEELKLKVLEYIDFLEHKAELEKPLSKNEINELKKRYEGYKANPDRAISLEDLSAKMFKKYGGE